MVTVLFLVPASCLNMMFPDANTPLENRYKASDAAGKSNETTGSAVLVSEGSWLL